jgi:hypothetical protein
MDSLPIVAAMAGSLEHGSVVVPPAAPASLIGAA